MLFIDQESWPLAAPQTESAFYLASPQGGQEGWGAPGGVGRGGGERGENYRRQNVGSVGIFVHCVQLLSMPRAGDVCGIQEFR